MKVIEITLSKGKKVNLGNYESRDYFISMKVDLYSPLDYNRLIEHHFDVIEKEVQICFLAMRIFCMGRESTS